MKRYSVSKARTHLSRLVAEAAQGEDIEIAVFDQPYVLMTRHLDTDDGPEPLNVSLTDARNNWSQLLSTVANDDARFVFTNYEDDVYLHKAPQYSNPFIEQWQLHAATGGAPLSRERIEGALRVLTTLQRELGTLQKRINGLITVAEVAISTLPKDEL